MFSYIVPLLLATLLLYNPVVQYLSRAALGAQPQQIRRTPRPALNTDLLALEEDQALDSNFTCPKEGYSARIFSREPLVVYLEGFLSREERAHLVEISAPLFTPATITHNGGTSLHLDTSIRDSQVALIPRTPLVRCIEARARAFQGWPEEVWIERLRVQRYRAPGGHYAHHFDWSSQRGGWGRVSSFMVFVEDRDGEKEEGEKLRGGGTEFPLLERRGDGRWCGLVECPSDEHVQRAAAEASEGVTDDRKRLAMEQGVRGTVFKPIPGNAVYWENFRADGTGRGFEETWHAGLPVEAGMKIGLNIWSWGRLQ